MSNYTYTIQFWAHNTDGTVKSINNPRNIFRVCDLTSVDNIKSLWCYNWAQWAEAGEWYSYEVIDVENDLLVEYYDGAPEGYVDYL